MLITSSNRLVDDIQQKIIDKIDKTFEDESLDQANYYFKEGDFVEEFEASRSTIREAVRSLEVRGYVERVHGRGVRAIDKSMQVVAHSINDMLVRSGSTMDEIIEVRRIIEVKAAGIAAQRIDKKSCDKLKNYIDIMSNPNVSYNEYLDADLTFHRTIVKATNNNILIALVASYEHIMKEAIIASTDETYRPETNEKYHKKIYENLLRKDKEGAEAAMKWHLDATRKNMEELHKVEITNTRKISVG